MRQGQHNKNRSRNRGGGGGGGRRQQNPVNRVFESNGPDVKIRGNASHIAEKYNSLARDALVSGNTVTAENYFQHAEHYLRILAAAQAYNQQQAAQAAPPARAPEPSEASEANGAGEPGEQRPRGDRRRRREPVGDAAVAARESDDEQPVIAEQPAMEESKSESEAVEAKKKPKAKKANGAGKKRKKADAVSEDTEEKASGDDGAPEDVSEEVPASA